MIQASAIFKENLVQLPSIDGVLRIDLMDAQGGTVASIPNEAGKQGSLAVYQYLAQTFPALNAEAATHGLEIFAEHTADAKNRPGAHPNVDHLLAIANGGAALSIHVITA
jgi:hypothetical protein